MRGENTSKVEHRNLKMRKMEVGMEIGQERSWEIGETLPHREGQRHDWNPNPKIRMSAQIDQR